VAKVHPDSVLNFYVYADYTQPPVRTTKLAPSGGPHWLGAPRGVLG
jgi:hypothetical protein